MNQIAVLLSNFFEDMEYSEAVSSLMKEGYRMTIIGKRENELLVGRHGRMSARTDLAIEKANPEQFAGLLIPGGFSKDAVKANPLFKSFMQRFIELRKPVMTIYRGPNLLMTAEVLHGKKIAVPKQGDHQPIPTLWDEGIIFSGNLISSRNRAAITAFFEKALDTARKDA